MKFPFNILPLFLLFLFCCEVFSDWKLDKEADNRLVVQAILTDEAIHQEIFLSQSRPFLNSQVPFVENARVRVEANGVIFDFQADRSRPGRYRSEKAFRIVKDLDYQLLIDWDGETYTASSRLSRVAPIPQIDFEPRFDTSMMTLGPVGAVFDSNQDAMYEIDINWEHLENDSLAKARVYAYTFRELHINTLIRPQQEVLTFPRGSRVYIKKYGLSEDFAGFLQSMLIETNWSGNFYFSNPSSLPSNITPDGLGFFAACAVLKDTLVAQ